MPFTPNRRAFIRGLAVAGLAGIAGARPAFAASLPQPEGKVILTLSGRIANTNKDGVAQFDMAMIEKLGTQSFETTTPWYDGKVKFEGVPMARLMAHVGASGASITVKALNDYATDIPMDDFTRYPVILASKRDGNYMPVRDKGPLFIVYPYDSDPDLKHQRFYSRSAWQVAQIIVK
jgi:hypothetical protein